KLTFFYGPQALAEITPKMRSIASSAQIAIQCGDKRLAENPGLSRISRVFKIFVTGNPGLKCHPGLFGPFCNIHPGSAIFVSRFVQLYFLQPQVIRGTKIGLNMIVLKFLPKVQAKPEPKLQQIQQSVN
ncbi:MAG: hypothetical protein EZS28_051694, partial [Streblomastix strix]